MFRYLFALIFLVNLSYLPAQNSGLLPVRQNHKWGMIDAEAELVIPTKYDAIADQDFYVFRRNDRAGMRLRKVLLKDKVGLVDYSGKEIIPPEFQDLRPFDRSYVAAKIDSLEIAFNLENELVVSTQYKKIALLEKGYFKVKRNGLWGIHIEKGDCMIPPQFKSIRKVRRMLAKNYFFQATNDEDLVTWALYNANGDMLLPQEFEKHLAVSDRFFIAKRKEKPFGAWDDQGQQILKEEWKGVNFIPDHFVKLTSEKNTKHLFLILKNELFESDISYTDFQKSWSGYVRSVKGDNMGLIDSLGNEILLPEYKAIEYSGLEDIYYLRKKKWAMFSLKDSLLTKMEYDRISPFKQKVAVIVKNKLFGLMNPKGEVLVAPEYTDYQREDNFVKLFNGNELTMYELGEEGNIVSEEFYGETFTLKIGFDLVNGPEADTTTNNSLEGENIFVNNQAVLDYSLQQNSPYWWVQNETNNRWGMIDRSKNEKQIIPSVYTDIDYAGSTDWSIAFCDTSYITCPLAKLSAHPFKALQTKAIFSHNQGRFITGFKFMGIRYADFETGHPVASFIDESGRFGLIDKSGKELLDQNGKALRFSYIGAFNLGKARVSIKGTIGKVKEQHEEKLAFAHITEFVKAYNLNPKDRAYPNEKLFVRAGKWGYIDTLGNLVIDAEYTYANNFGSDSLAINMKGELWGVIDEANQTILDFEYSGILRYDHDRFRIAKSTRKSIFYNRRGKEIIGLKYDRFGKKSESLIRVKQDQAWGYINDLGNEIIACQYAVAKDFQNGRAPVREGKYWFFINPEGNILVDLSAIRPLVKDVGHFHNGLAWFKAGEKYGYVDEQGIVRIEPKFKKAYDFCKGVASVLTEKEAGLIDTQGNYVLPPGKYSYIGPFNQFGLAIIKKQYDGWVGLVNTKAEIVAPIKYQQIKPYKNDYAEVIGMRGFGMLDSLGREIFPAIYGNIGAISDGLVSVRPSYSYTSHYVNLKHQKVFKGNYDIAMPFQSDFAIVRVDERDIKSQYLINKKGQRIHEDWEDVIELYSEGIYGMYVLGNTIGLYNHYFANEDGENIFGSRSFMETKAFDRGLAPVKHRFKWGAIGLHGLFMIPPKYSRITMLPTGMIQARPGVIFGLANKQGEILIPVAYDMLERVNQKKWLQLEIGDRIGYADFDGNWIWEMQR